MTFNCNYTAMWDTSYVYANHEMGGCDQSCPNNLAKNPVKKGTIDQRCVGGSAFSLENFCVDDDVDEVRCNGHGRCVSSYNFVINYNEHVCDCDEGYNASWQCHHPNVSAWGRWRSLR